MSHPSKELSESALDALIVEERSRMIAPLTEWPSLFAQLKEEGMIQTAGSAVPPFDFSSPRAGSFNRSFTSREIPQRRFNALRWGASAFASLVLVGAGVLIGRSWTPGEERAESRSSQVASASKATIKEQTPIEAVSYEFRTPAEALETIKRAQVDYVMAAAYLAAHDEKGQPVTSLANLRDRLAALDVVVTAAQNAVKESPNDPVLNQYYVSSSGARKATLQLLNQNLPNGAQLY